MGNMTAKSVCKISAKGDTVMAGHSTLIEDKEREENRKNLSRSYSPK
jgi:hypothetical protein